MPEIDLSEIGAKSLVGAMGRLVVRSIERAIDWLLYVSGSPRGGRGKEGVCEQVGGEFGDDCPLTIGGASDPAGPLIPLKYSNRAIVSVPLSETPGLEGKQADIESNREVSRNWPRFGALCGLGMKLHV